MVATAGGRRGSGRNSDRSTSRTRAADSNPGRYRPGRGGGEGEDGLIDVRKILKLRLDADAVVLSACTTSVPSAEERFQGESLSGLARAFFFAGARSLLVSDWQIPDKTTADLMIDLFQDSRRGQGLAYALQAAQLRIMQDKATADPYHWAAFSIVGDGARYCQIAFSPFSE